MRFAWLLVLAALAIAAAAIVLWPRDKPTPADDKRLIRQDAEDTRRIADLHWKAATQPLSIFEQEELRLRLERYTKHKIGGD